MLWKIDKIYSVYSIFAIHTYIHFKILLNYIIYIYVCLYIVIPLYLCRFKHLEKRFIIFWIYLNVSCVHLYPYFEEYPSIFLVWKIFRIVILFIRMPSMNDHGHTHTHTHMYICISYRIYLYETLIFYLHKL